MTSIGNVKRALGWALLVLFLDKREISPFSLMLSSLGRRIRLRSPKDRSQIISSLSDYRLIKGDQLQYEIGIGKKGESTSKLTDDIEGFLVGERVDIVFLVGL